jgi:DNA-directed RNA polymerase subunit RPC12/RpoP
MKEYQCSKCRRLVGKKEIVGSQESTSKCPYCGGSNLEKILEESFCSMEKSSSSKSAESS